MTFTDATIKSFVTCKDSAGNPTIHVIALRIRCSESTVKMSRTFELDATVFDSAVKVIAELKRLIGIEYENFVCCQGCRAASPTVSSQEEIVTYFGSNVITEL